MGKLLKMLSEYGNGDVLAFHMPGHKRKYKGEDPFYAEYCKRDITEIEGFDDLHDPTGILKELQEEAAVFMGADSAFYLVNGSTAGVMAAICSAVPKGGRLIMQRESHMSAYHAVMLHDITPVYLYGEHDGYGILSGIDIEEIKKCGPADALFITSPTYEGVVQDIKKYAEYAHSAGMKLIVDAAHGAHFCMGGIFPVNALRLGADYEVVSVHKTMSAPTQTALLGLGKGADPDKTAAFLDMFQSSSPSYPLMAGIEESLDIAGRTSPEEMQAWLNLRKTIDEECRDLKRFKLKSFEGNDPYKLTILMSDHAGGVQAAKALRERYGIEIEMALPSYMLLILSISDEEADYKRLVQALHELDKEAAGAEAFDNRLLIPESVMRPSEAYGREYRKFALSEAAGKVSAGMLVAYPPGRPIAAPGERITEETVTLIRSLHEQGVNIRGLDKDMRIKVL